MYFSFLIPSSKFSHILFPALKFTDSFLIYYFWVYTCICMYIYIPKYLLLSHYNDTFSRPTIWYCTANRCSIPWGEPHSHSQVYFIPCSSLCRTEGSWAFPNSVCHICWYYPYLVHVWMVILLSLYEHSFFWSITFYKKKYTKFGGIEERRRV